MASDCEEKLDLRSAYEIIKFPDDGEHCYAYQLDSGKYIKLGIKETILLEKLDGSNSMADVGKMLPEWDENRIKGFLKQLGHLPMASGSSIPSKVARRRNDFRLSSSILSHINRMKGPSLGWAVLLFPFSALGYWYLLTNLHSSNFFYAGFHPMYVVLSGMILLPFGSIVHELGHVWFARQSNVKVLGMGFTLLWGIVPLFYCDLESERTETGPASDKQLLVSVGGAYLQLLFGGIVALVWAGIYTPTSLIRLVVPSWVLLNLVSAFGNLLPVYPLDGYWAFKGLRDTLNWGKKAMDSTPPVSAPLEHAVVVDNLQIVYGNSSADVAALETVHLSVQTGEALGLVGHNGAGKTTLFLSIAGLLSPAKGSVKVFGQRSGTLEARKSIGLVSEQVGLYDEFTVLEMLRLYAGLYGVGPEGIRAAVNRFGLHPYENRRVKTLSTGWRKRVSLACACIHEPRLLLLDEPFSNIDPIALQDIKSILQTLQREKKCTIIISSHNLDEISAFCDRIAVLKSGRLMAAAPLDVLRQSFSSTEGFLLRFEQRLPADLMSKYRLMVKDEKKHTVFLNDEKRLPSLLKEAQRRGFGLHSVEREGRTLHELYRELYDGKQLREGGRRTDETSWDCL